MEDKIRKSAINGLERLLRDYKEILKLLKGRLEIFTNDRVQIAIEIKSYENKILELKKKIRSMKES